MARYGGLVNRVRRPYLVLPVVLMAKQAAIATASLFLSRAPAVLLAVLLALILGGGLVSADIKPHYFRLYDQLDLALTVVLTALLLMGLVLYAEGANGGSTSAPARASSSRWSI